MTKYEKTLMNMTPAQRKKVMDTMSDMMGMPPLKKKPAKKTASKSKGRKK